MSTSCTIDDCESPRSARGFCNLHYQRLIKHGSARWAPPTVAERFWARVAKSNGCWEWTGYVRPDGYGWTGERLAHRAAYELELGAIPNGLQLDHLCRNRRCVRPDHLEPVTARENTERSDTRWAQMARTGRCQRNHLMEGANVYVTPQGYRRCLACVAIRRAERQGVAA